MSRLMHFIGSLILAILFGYIVGRIATVNFALAEVPPISLRQEERIEIPVIRFEGIRDNALRGTIRGDARLFLGDQQVLMNESGSFAIDPGPLLIADVTVLIPPGMHFVASRRGSRYYPVLSRQGEQIVPENRVYFRTSDEAEAAGFRGN